MEYTRFGEKVLQRKDASEEWKEVPADDRNEAEIELRIAEKLRAENKARGPRGSARIIRHGGGT